MQTSKQKQTTAHFWSLCSSTRTEGPRRSWESQCVWSQRQWRLALWTLKKRPDSGTVPQKKEEGSGNGRRVFLVGKKHGTRAGGGFTACHAFITHDTAFKWRLSQYLQHHTKVRYTPHIFIFLSRSLTFTVSFKGAVTFVKYCIYHTYIYMSCVFIIVWHQLCFGRGGFLLSIQAVFAGSDTHLVRASSSLMTGYSSGNTLKTEGEKMWKWQHDLRQLSNP